MRWQHAPEPLPGATPPALHVLIPPAAVAEVQNLVPVWPAAALAPAFGTAEPDRRRQLAPVDRVEPAVAGEDGHGWGSGDVESRSYGAALELGKAGGLTSTKAIMLRLQTASSSHVRSLGYPTT